MTNGARFIVAEVTKNWQDGRALDVGGALLSQLFETVINLNDQRGYGLHSFQVQGFLSPHPSGLILTETIVAVFERRDGAV